MIVSAFLPPFIEIFMSFDEDIHHIILLTCFEPQIRICVPFVLLLRIGYTSFYVIRENYRTGTSGLD